MLEMLNAAAMLVFQAYRIDLEASLSHQLVGVHVVSQSILLQFRLTDASVNRLVAGCILQTLRHPPLPLPALKTFLRRVQ